MGDRAAFARPARRPRISPAVRRGAGTVASPRAAARRSSVAASTSSVMRATSGRASMAMMSPSSTSAIGPAHGGLGRGIADAHAPRRAREAAVGQQRRLRPHALAVEQRGDAQHLLHARASPSAPRRARPAPRPRGRPGFPPRAGPPPRRRRPGPDRGRSATARPATLSSAPFGQRLPVSTTIPPVGAMGATGLRTISPSGAGRRCRRPLRPASGR